MKMKSLLMTSAFFTLLLSLAQAENNSPTSATNSSATTAAQPEAATYTEEQIKKIDSIAAASKLAEFYNAKGDIERFTWTLKRLTELMPNSGELKYQLAVAYAQQDKKTEAYDLLIRMQMLGFAYDISKDERFKKLRDTKVWEYIVANLNANKTPFGEGQMAFKLPAQDALFESLAYDSKRKQFLVGSVREGKIYLASSDGKLSEFIQPDENNGLLSVYDLAVDSKNDLLYVASTGAVHFKGFKQENFGKASVIKFQLSTGKFLANYPVKGEGTHILSTITVSKDGQVFVADGVRNEIYKLDAAGLKLLLRNPKLTSIRGMAVSDDGKSLYFADYALGVFGIDLTKSLGFDVRFNNENMVLGGIDGLYYYQGHLIAIENGMVPQRIMRLKLSDDGRSLQGGMPLDVANAAFKLPTFGTIADDHLYFIANSQKGLYDQYGVLKDKSKLQPVEIFKSNLRFEWGKISVGKMGGAIPKASPEEARKMLNTPPKGFGDAEVPPKEEKK